jgi:multidrug resistance efflux pump
MALWTKRLIMSETCMKETLMSIDPDKRKAWETKTKARLEKLEAEFNKLKAQSHELSGEAAKRHHQWMEKVKKKRDEARDRWQDIQATGGDSWDQVKEGSEHLWEEFSSALAGARDALRKHRSD